LRRVAQSLETREVTLWSQQPVCRILGENYLDKGQFVVVWRPQIGEKFDGTLSRVDLEVGVIYPFQFQASSAYQYGGARVFSEFFALRENVQIEKRTNHCRRVALAIDDGVKAGVRRRNPYFFGIPVRPTAAIGWIHKVYKRANAIAEQE